MQLLSRIGDRSARANAVSGNGAVVVGWQDFHDDFPYRIGSIWQGKYQTILTEPKSVTDYNPAGYVGEVMAINSAGNVAVGIEAGADLNDSFIWTPSAGTRNLGGDPVPVCFWSWDVQDTVCAKRKTIAYSISDDAKVITGASRFSDFWNGVYAADGAIFTPKLGWMQLSKFLQSQGVLEATNWLFFSTRVSGDGKTLIGTGLPARVATTTRAIASSSTRSSSAKARRPCGWASRMRWTSSSRPARRSGSAPATRRSEGRAPRSSGRRDRLGAASRCNAGSRPLSFGGSTLLRVP